MDGGSDGHVSDLKGWLLLVDLNGPCTDHVDVVGHCHEITKKTKLQVGDVMTKVIRKNGKTEFLCTRHMLVKCQFKAHS